MKKKKTNKKIASALAMLMLSAAMLGTSTYAWFTMNKSVEVTGMTVHTTVDSNLLISDDTLSSTSKNADSTFTTNVLTQTLEKILEPVSTTDGNTFYYTVNAKANGDAVEDVYTTYSSSAGATGASASDYMDKFSQDYGLTKDEAAAIVNGEDGALPYVDYVFQLKADNTSAATQYINMTKMDLTYTAKASEPDTNKAYRAAVFIEDITSGAATAGTGTLIGLYKDSTAVNFEAGNKTVNSGTSVAGTPTYISSATAMATVPANTTKYYKVVVRLYIEGEDTTCYTALFKNLVGKWALDLKYELQATVGGVTELDIK